MKRVTPRELHSILQKTIEARLPVFVWGSPGTGKSAITQQVAEKMGIDFIDVRLSQLDPTDLRGLPAIKGDHALWLSPTFLPQPNRNKEKGVLFLDELNVAPPLVQAAAYQLILDRKVGEYTLPSGWSIVSAGNRMEDATVTFQMPAALKNRFLHLELEPNLEDWKIWAFKNNIDKRIIAFLNFRPELLFKFDKKKNAFPTPRSWEFCSRAIESGLDIETAALSSVGEGAATELSAFLKIYRDLPSPAHILSRKIQFEEPSQMYAVCEILIHYVQNHMREKEKLLDYILSIKKKEFSVVLARDALECGIPLNECKEWGKFQNKFQHLFEHLIS
ncbi:MAG: MoxR family ATPase [Deltaproteobacteria bacterium]|nr:MoxR family ATPase [Deltaproteobacteria bacterium]